MKPRDEEMENFIQVIDHLREEEVSQKNISEQEMEDNAIKMGDVYYLGLDSFLSF